MIPASGTDAGPPPQHEALQEERNEREADRETHEGAHAVEAAEAREVEEEALEDRHDEERERRDARGPRPPRDPRREERDREERPAERVGEPLGEGGRERVHDEAPALGEDVRDLEVQEDEEERRAPRREEADRLRPRRRLAVEERGGDEERGGRDGVDPEVPVEDRGRGPRVVREDGRIQREAHERGEEKRERPRDEAAMADAPVEPRERRPEERPAEREPLPLELQGNGDRHEGERRARHERQARAVLLRRDPEREEAREERGHPQRHRERKEPDDAPVSPVLERPAQEREQTRARDDGGEVRCALPPRALPEDDRMQDEERPEDPGEERVLLPGRAHAPSRRAPCPRGEDRGPGGENGEARLGRARRHREKRDEEEGVRREDGAERGRARHERHGHRHRLRADEADGRRAAERERPVEDPRRDAAESQASGARERGERPRRVPGRGAKTAAARSASARLAACTQAVPARRPANAAAAVTRKSDSTSDAPGGTASVRSPAT